MTRAMFWVLWGIDAVATALFVCFFFVGLGDGSVSSFNIGLWVTILAALAVVMAGSLRLKAKGRPGFALALLLLLAAPGLLYGAFLLAIVIANPNWN